MHLPGKASATILFAAVFTASCDRPAIDPSDSLVGVKKLPSAKELRRETIAIMLGDDKSLKRSLSYELRPDNSLSVTISATNSGKPLTVQKLQLRPTDADAVRTKLWRVRPEEMKGVAWPIQPSDCPAPPTDTHPILSIAFLKEGPDPGYNDDEIRVFILPYPHTCDTPQGKLAREVVDEALMILPGPKLRSEYVYHRPLP